MLGEYITSVEDLPKHKDESGRIIRINVLVVVFVDVAVVVVDK